MSNGIAVMIAKDMEKYLLLIYALRQLDGVTSPWYMKIDSNQFININTI